MAHLPRICPGSDLEISCHPGSHFIRTDFAFPRQDLNLAAFNLTSSVDLDNEADLDTMGLLIASHLVDRFRITRQPDGNPVLTLIKDFLHPEMISTNQGEHKALASFAILPAGEAQTKWFLRLVQQFYPPVLFPADFPLSRQDRRYGGGRQVPAAARRQPRRGDRRRGRLAGGRPRSCSAAHRRRRCRPTISNPSAWSQRPAPVMPACR